MGPIRIRDRKLIVEVNSAERARSIRALSRRLWGLARYRRTRKQPLESVIPPVPPGPGVQVAPRNAAQNELMQLPEVRVQLQEFQRRHYERWPRDPAARPPGSYPIQTVSVLATPDKSAESSLDC
jgi:hypothetical protein